MGNEGGCMFREPQGRSVKLNESSCVEFVEDIPRFRGVFNFEKHSTYSKIEKAAAQFCLANDIDRAIYSPYITRLLASHHYQIFAAFKHIPKHLRQQFVEQLIFLQTELMDSLWNHFILRQSRKMNPTTTIGEKNYMVAGTVDLKQVPLQLRLTLQAEGIRLIKKGKVAILIMIAGHSQKSYHTSKAFKKLPLIGEPTVLQLMLKRLHSCLYDSKQDRSEMPSNTVLPIIFACDHDNEISFRKYIQQNNYFGFLEKNIKVISVAQLPILSETGQYCLNFSYKTVMWPEGTAKCLEQMMGNRIQSFLKYHQIEYLHVIGCENLAQFPGDPLLLGIAHKLDRKIAAKCVNPAQVFQKHPRYVCSRDSFHLLNIKELQYLDSLVLLRQSPVALNSMVFHLQSLYEIYQNYEKDMYMSRRYHLLEIYQDYYDFQVNTPVTKAKCFAFQKDIRDYISCSQDAILVNYSRNHFIPISESEPIVETCRKYQMALEELRRNSRFFNL